MSTSERVELTRKSSLLSWGKAKKKEANMGTYSENNDSRWERGKVVNGQVFTTHSPPYGKGILKGLIDRAYERAGTPFTPWFARDASSLAPTHSVTYGWAFNNYAWVFTHLFLPWWASLQALGNRSCVWAPPSGRSGRRTSRNRRCGPRPHEPLRKRKPFTFQLHYCDQGNNLSGTKKKPRFFVINLTGFYNVMHL